MNLDQCPVRRAGLTALFAFVPWIVGIGPAAAQTATLSASSAQSQYNAEDVDEICSDGVGDEISFTITNNTGTSSTSDSNELWMWWQDDDDDCVIELPGQSSSAFVYEEELEDTSGLLVGDPFRVPTQLSDADFSLTEGDALSFVGACQTEQETTLSLCVAVDRRGGDNRDQIDENEIWSALLIDIDTIAPDAPTIANVVGLDGGLRIGLEETSETNRYRVRYTSEEDSDCSGWSTYEQATVSANGAEIELSGLDNDTRYRVCAAGLDDAGNRGPFSDTVSGRPNDELELSEALGDELLPGCSQGGPGAGVLALLLYLLGLAAPRLKAPSRPKRRLASAMRLPAACSLLAANIGVAYAAPWGLAVEGGAMRPAIGTDAQRDTFREIHAESYSGDLGAPVRLDVRGRIWLKESLARPFLDVGAAMWRSRGTALNCSGATCVPGETTTSFFLFPLHAGLGLELELDRYSRDGEHGGIPFAVSAEAGLEYQSWISYTGTRTAVTTGGEKYRGASWGGALGLSAAHHLNWATGDMAGRSTTGLAGIDLVGGYNLSRSLSGDSRYDFSADWWNIGLRFLFI